MTRYVSAADTAKLIRAQLKAKFPGVKFSVRTSVYAGGASIDVSWTDGPTSKLVDQVVKPFAGGGFDGMIDMAYSVEAFLLEDGSAAFAQTSGTEGSTGMVAAAKAFKPTPGAERVRFLSDYVFTKRNCSERLVRSALLSFARKFGQDVASAFTVKVSDYDGFARASIDTYGTDSQFYERQFQEILSRRVIAR